ncbi:MAG: dihydropteroate synthase [Desulfobacterales bacterium]|nr:dihydropteroate synthase [Desulfobacterales bacterium]MDD4073852.1 dihydropteroate synthase [Desulfobacterales bacterium]MDD4392070.1 dihydropteroate synthase [Desulfobacterales bacterium]
MKTFTISWGNHRLELGQRTCVMGIVNVTPDSFSDGGKFSAPDSALAHAEKLVEDGADILDIGGESTRPFSKPVSAEEELHRVAPVIEQIAQRVSIPISIDTFKSRVAKGALDAGASMINDIGALRMDKDMAAVAAAYDVPVIVMHMKGTPRTMQVSPAYDDIIEEIKSFMKDTIHRAERNGIPPSRIIVDPGIGFGKTGGHNLLLLKRLKEFESLEMPLLVGSSRKAFIRNILMNKTGRPMEPDSPEVETGTQATICTAVLHGAHIVRVHNVAMARMTVDITDAIKHA